MGRVTVVDYDPSWPETFREIRDGIAPGLSPLATAVEHVGSTAVPGLAAKPVIDLDVVVRPDDVPEAIARLSKMGYAHRGDLGVTGREAFHPPQGTPDHHLYLCPQGSAALANHLAVRDHLRTHPEDARAYGELKRRLAREFPQDGAAYLRGKTSFLLRILASAGFDQTLLDEVSRPNRSG